MEELQGFVVQAELGRVKTEVSLIASGPAQAISRVRLALVHHRRDMRWLSAAYTVLETVSLEEFQAGRSAGTR